MVCFQSAATALQDTEDGLGSEGHAGYPSGNVHLRVRTLNRILSLNCMKYSRGSCTLSFSLPVPCFHRYIGEIITDAEADKRENDSFLFTLDNKVT